MFMSASSHVANLIIPYPETDNWYLSLQLVCPASSEYVARATCHGLVAMKGSSCVFGGVLPFYLPPPHNSTSGE